METWEREARLSIADLIARYTRAGDTGRAAEFSELFAEAGEFEINGGRRARGHQAIAELMDEVKDAFAKAPPRSSRRAITSRVSPSTSTIEITPPVAATSC